ncbi:MAG TPA: ABC transporter ATP-binding protein [Flavobacteriales bacterium]|nr:ABC transporter ATP-binding protein [Flavobacteriales bacterium]
MERSDKNILEVKNLVTEFATDDGIVRAVDGISFNLKPGETLGIVGESGSGKSVTSLSIMQLIQKPTGRISQGEIIFDKWSAEPLFETKEQAPNLLEIGEKNMRKVRGNDIAMIFQEPMTSLNPVYTCGQQVTEAILQHRDFPDVSAMKNMLETIIKKLIWASPFLIMFGIWFVPMPFAGAGFLKFGVDVACLVFLYFELHQRYLTTKERVAKDLTLDLFAQTELPDPERMFRSYPHQLSGGQKQRVMIAMAMSCNPKILIADEPTTALDVTIQKTILELMKSLQRKHNMGIIFITHDLGVVAELADKVMVMYKGKIVEEGLVRDIFKNPRHPYTKGLLACRPRLDVRLTKLPVVSDFMHTDENNIITESGYNVDELIEQFKISPAQREEQLNQIYSRQPILQVRNLSKWFSKGKNVFGKTNAWTKAVDDVSFDVYEGETVGLVGESGCGKTTLGRALIRLVEPTAGKVLYQGKDLAKVSESEMRMLRRDLQIIFQDPYSSLNPRMTIGEAIMEPMRVHGILKNDTARKNRVVEILERVNMKPGHFGRYPHEFSGGQRQRICIARSIALQPKFIICDESVSALDVSVQAQVLNLLNELKRDFNFTYIFISHDLSVVKFMSDRMLVMNQGKIVEMDIAEKIYANPTQEYTRKLIQAIPKGL